MSDIERSRADFIMSEVNSAGGTQANFADQSRLDRLRGDGDQGRRFGRRRQCCYRRGRPRRCGSSHGGRAGAAAVSRGESSNKFPARTYDSAARHDRRGRSTVRPDPRGGNCTTHRYLLCGRSATTLRLARKAAEPIAEHSPGCSTRGGGRLRDKLKDRQQTCKRNVHSSRFVTVWIVTTLCVCVVLQLQALAWLT